MLWMSTLPATGTVGPDDTQPLNVIVDAAGLVPGTYQAELVVRTNDPLNRIIKTIATLVVAN